MTIVLVLCALAALFFAAGFGYGQWWAERQIRSDAARLAKGRMQVTLPVDPEDAANVLELLGTMVRELEQRRQEP